MKMAIVYDYLNQSGGGERVLKTIGEIFPDAPLYTILYDQTKINFLSEKRITTSFLDFPLARKHHRLFIPLMPRAIEGLNLRDEYDVILSVGAGYAKGISYHPKTKHLHYCFTPLRYAWEPWRYTGNIFLKPLIGYLRSWDYKMGQRPDLVVAISNFIADKVKRFYGREAQVLYPPIDETKFFYDPTIQKQNYFLAAGRLLYYKKFDLVIEAFNKLGWPLKIVGTGPEYWRLKKMIRSPKIEMVGFASDDQLRKLYAGARAAIFPQVEDYGLVPVEAQACGTPVIAFAGGGALETVEEGKTGFFFQSQTVGGLIDALKKFRDIKVERRDCQNFKDRLYSLVLSLWKQN